MSLMGQQGAWLEITLSLWPILTGRTRSVRMFSLNWTASRRRDTWRLVSLKGFERKLLPKIGRPVQLKVEKLKSVQSTDFKY